MVLSLKKKMPVKVLSVGFFLLSTSCPKFHRQFQSHRTTFHLLTAPSTKETIHNFKTTSYLSHFIGWQGQNSFVGFGLKKKKILQGG